MKPGASTIFILISCLVAGIGTVSVCADEIKSLIVAPPGLSADDPSNILLRASLVQLAETPEAAGEILFLSLHPDIVALYESWASDPENIETANAIAGKTRNLVISHAKSNPALEYVILVGGDAELPFFRTPDQSILSESELPISIAAPAVRAARDEGYYLSDAPYGCIEPIAMNDGVLYTPDLVVSRLVGDATDAVLMIWAFVSFQRNLESPLQSLIAGDNHAEDGARIIELIHSEAGFSTETFFDYWEPKDLDSTHTEMTDSTDLVALNLYADPWSLGTPSGISITADDLNAYPSLFGKSCFQILGAHAGLSGVSDEPTLLDAIQNQTVFTTIASTGFSLGAREGLGLSERLTLLFQENLADCAGYSAGQAFREAKRDFLSESWNLDATTRKMSDIMTLFGIPQVSIRSHEYEEPACTLPLSRGYGVTVQRVEAQFDEYIPQNTDWGAYFTLDGHSTTAIQGKTLQPLHVMELSASGPPPRGVIMLEAEYYDLPGINPVFAQIVDFSLFDTSLGEGEVEPMRDLRDWEAARVLKLPEWQRPGYPSLLIRPGQFRAGTQRLYNKIIAHVYRSDNAIDATAPAIHSAIFQPAENGFVVKANVTDSGPDDTGVNRILVTYTNGNGYWKSNELIRVAGNEYEGFVDGSGSFNVFIQAVDMAGNVSDLFDAGETYFPVVVRPQMKAKVEIRLRDAVLQVGDDMIVAAKLLNIGEAGELDTYLAVEGLNNIVFWPNFTSDPEGQEVRIFLPVGAELEGEFFRTKISQIQSFSGAWLAILVDPGTLEIVDMNRVEFTIN